MYDYLIAIPRQQQTYDRFADLKKHLEELEKINQPSQEQIADFNKTQAELTALSPGGSPPVKPGKFNRATQLFYIACFPFTFYFVWLYAKAKRQVYRLDENGGLHFEADPALGSGVWAMDQIADIDMSRWMSKSIAHAVHTDGTRLKLDAYLHKNLDLIIGAIASRLYPDKWDEKARPVKPADEPLPEETTAEHG